MAGYINGKMEIFCGDYPPVNLNLLWYKRVVIDDKDYYGLYEYDRHINAWQPLNSSFDVMPAGQYTGSTPPVNPQENWIWISPTTGNQYIYYDNAWVPEIIETF